MSVFARVIVAASLAWLTGSAQQAALPVATSRSMTVHVAVTTDKGDPVRGLTQQSFKLLDNKAERPITSVREAQGSSAAASVILVVDAVNLPYTRVAYARAQVQKFLKANGGHLALPTTIAIVTDKGTQIQQGFSKDGNVLSAGLGQYTIGLRSIRRDAGFWGANERVQISLKALREVIGYGGSLPGRKLLMWVSPGWPLLSGARVDLDDRQREGIFKDVVSLTGAMQKANLTLYDVDPLGPEESLFRSGYYRSFLKGVSKPSQTDIADLSLQVLATGSGGLVTTGNSDVAGSLAKYTADAGNGYDLTFQTAAPEHVDEYHHLQVEVATPGAIARTRDGYYAQP